MKGVFPKIRAWKRIILTSVLELALCGLLLGLFTSTLMAQEENAIKPGPPELTPTYWVNIDVKNSTDTWVNDYHIVVEKARIVEWYTGFLNPWGKGEIVRETTTALDIPIMEIKWGGKDAQRVPPGDIIHLGYQAEGTWSLSKPKYHPMGTCAWFTQDGNRVKAMESIIPGIRYEDKGWHITIYVKNDTGFPNVDFSSLEYTVRSKPVDINDLYWNNPVLEWEPLGEPQTINLGEEVAVGALEASGEKYVIVRMICTDLENPSNYVRVLFQRRADPPKSESEGSMKYQVILAGFILLSGIFIVLKERKKSDA
jgi:hypothetical protein